MEVPPRLRTVIERLSMETDGTIARERYHLVRAEPPPISEDVLIFLGTGGNPTNLVGQHRATGGFYLAVNGLALYVDPGPGAIVHAVAAGVDLRNLSACYISHGHTDHVLCAGAVIEAMCRGMTARRGLLFAPPSVLRDGLVSRYHQGLESSPWYPGGPEAVLELVPGLVVDLGGGTIRTTPAHHGGENLGFRLETPGLSVGYTSDTRYLLRYRTWEGEERSVTPGEKVWHFQEALAVEEDVAEAHRGVDLLIVNVSFFDQHAHRHITLFGAVDLLLRVRPRLAILTHFDPSLGTPAGRAEEAADLLSGWTGVPVLAARDGMRLELSSLRSS